jgi:hypothetical protein
MSTLWTPSGERPIRRGPPEGESAPRPPEGGPVSEAEARELSAEEQAAQLQQLEEQLARTPVEVVVANHAVGLFELGRLHLTRQPPQLDQARLAIDSLAALVEGLAGRLGEHEGQLKDGLAQLRLAFVQIRAVQRPNGESKGGGPKDPQAEGSGTRPEETPPEDRS